MPPFKPHDFHGLLAQVLVPVNENFRYKEDGTFALCTNLGFGYCHSGLAYGNTFEELSESIVRLQEAFFAKDQEDDKARCSKKKEVAA